MTLLIWWFAFIDADGIIGNIRRQYIDTRTQSNLSKLNGHRRQDLDVITQDLSTIVERRQQLGKLHFPCSVLSVALVSHWKCIWIHIHRKNTWLYYQIRWKNWKKQWQLLVQFPQYGAPPSLRYMQANKYSGLPSFKQLAKKIHKFET